MKRCILAILIMALLTSLAIGVACLGTSSSDSSGSDDDDDNEGLVDDDDDGDDDGDDDECIFCDSIQECVDALGPGWLCLDHCCETIGDDDVNDDIDDDSADDDVNDDVDDDADDDVDDDVDDDIDDDADDDINDDVNDDVDDDVDDDSDDDVEEGELKISLLWGAVPVDLDMHMWAPHAGCEAENPFHLYYIDSESSGGHGCSEDFALVQDDLTSYGPEIIEIYHPVPNEEFRLLVQDYSNLGCIPGNCSQMSNSFGLSVKVESSDDSWEFTMPSNTQANLWYVFNAIYTGDNWLVWEIGEYCFEQSSGNVYGCD